MNLKEIREIARQRMEGSCRLCRVCNGVVCAGETPGMGGVGSGAGFQNNVAALQRIRLNMRTLHDVMEPDLRVELFGLQLDFPVLAAPVAGMGLNFPAVGTEEDLARWAVVGAKMAGTLGMSGDGPDPTTFPSGLRAIQHVHGHGIPVVKPLPLQDLQPKIEQAEQAGCVALAMDIDAAGILMMRRAGYRVGPKTKAEIADIVASTKLPFILKGIMTADDAEKAVEAGVAGIVVSNHGGRILDHTPGTAEVLGEIAAAVQGRITVLMDGGIRSGFDVMKALALGADAVLVGRPLTVAGFGNGEQGVCTQLLQFRDELERAMVLTGCRTLADVGPHVIRQA